MNLSLSNCSILEGEPTIKNAHTASHLRILNNQFLFLCVEESLHVYSLPKMANNKASLISVTRLSTIFAECPKEYYEDFITSIFRNAQKQDFSAQIFSQQQNTQRNALLKNEHIQARLNFFNNNKMTLSQCLFGQRGQLLLGLQDGRAAVVISEDGRWHKNSFKIINLNESTHENIVKSCFVGPDGICILTKDRLTVYDTPNGNKLMSHRISFSHISEMTAQQQKDRIRVILVCNKSITMIEVNKKKILSSKILEMPGFISQSFCYHSHMFVVTPISLMKVQYSNGILTTSKVAEFQQPQQLLFVDEFGNQCQKSTSNDRETVWLADCTSNGVFAGLTIRRNGNYKEGRLIIFQPNLPYFLKRLITCIVSKKFAPNLQDALFVNKTKQNKDLLASFSNLHKKTQLQYQGITLNNQQYDTVLINIGHAFQGKQFVKNRIIERSLKRRFEERGISTKNMNFDDLTARCCFTGIRLMDDTLVYCLKCDLFGIKESGSRCPVCMAQMKLYQ